MQAVRELLTEEGEGRVLRAPDQTRDTQSKAASAGAQGGPAPGQQAEVMGGGVPRKPPLLSSGQRTLCRPRGDPRTDLVLIESVYPPWENQTTTEQINAYVNRNENSGAGAD